MPPEWGQPAGRPPRESGEESPGSMENRGRVTPGGGNPRESATESRPPRLYFGSPVEPVARFSRNTGGARVKGWGKSPPRPRRRGRHGKSHREQDQEGTARAIRRKAGARL